MNAEIDISDVVRNVSVFYTGEARKESVQGGMYRDKG